MNEGSTSSITLRLSSSIGSSLQIPVTVSNGTAESGDYSVSGLSGGTVTVTISAGATSGSFTISATEDALSETDETVNLSLGALPSGVTAGTPSTATLTISDDDATPVPPGATNTPTPTNTPSPAPLDLTSRSSAIDVDRAKAGDKVGKIYLDWDDVSGSDVTYEVQQKKVKTAWPDEWETLLDGVTVSGVVISNLDYDRSYHHRVIAWRGDQEYARSKELETKVPLPHTGHQADHTVKYQLGAISTPVPGAEASSDPGLVIPAAVTDAANAWNNAATTVLFCKGSGCTDAGGPPPVQVDRNTDGVIFVIKTEPGKEDITLAYVEQRRDPDGHLRGPATMVIEQPPIDRSGIWNTPVTRVWTNDLNLHGREERGGERKYHYLPSVMMHEFGHTAGLGDLYKLVEDTFPCNWLGICAYSDYIMGGDVEETAITDKDRDYLRDVYRNHTPHPI